MESRQVLNPPIPCQWSAPTAASRRHTITVAAAHRLHRGGSFLIAGDALIVDRTGIQAAQAE